MQHNALHPSSSPAAPPPLEPELQGLEDDVMEDAEDKDLEVKQMRALADVLRLGDLPTSSTHIRTGLHRR